MGRHAPLSQYWKNRRMLPRMMADNKTTPIGSQSELNDSFERRIVEVFVWLLTDEPINDKRRN